MQKEILIPATTPAFIIKQQALQHSAHILQNLRKKSGCHILYSIKALPFMRVLEYLQPSIDGFSVSSLFEAKLAREALDKQQSIHLTTPGIRPDEVEELSQLCSHISFNSTGQRQMFNAAYTSQFSAGLRINPKLSFAKDQRFDPCRKHSKLGLSIDDIELSGVEGLHFHTAFSQTDYQSLLQTIEKLQQQLGTKFAQLTWINLGGGYLFNQIEDHQAFIELIINLREQYELQVYLEPGKAVVGETVDLVSSVLDCFVSDGKMVAVLDTSINHNPEVFEYQRQPSILQHSPIGKHSTILVGSSCLAGDVFGEYQFEQPLQVGDKIHFTQLGAYSLVKANRFNGYNYPDIYWSNTEGLQRVKYYDYEDYREHWMAS